MPAAPKSPRANKKVTGITKPKGAVRAKSGCYTCRIRRKKCDEKRVGAAGDRCETCIRLKLECLGFGAKRPDWLRESHRVSQIRDRIKAHLAAQGMIKGHAGSGSRNPVQDEILMLSEYREGDTGNYNRSGTSSTNSSPSPRDASVESDRPYSGRLTLQQMTSSVRGYYDYHPPVRDDTYFVPHHDFQSSRCDSPSDSMMYHDNDNDNLYPPMEELYALTPETPATKSSFSNLYHFEPLLDDFQPPMPYDPMNPNLNFIAPSILVPLELIDKSMHEYVINIVKIQYLLGDSNKLPTMVWEAVSTHPASQEAVRSEDQNPYRIPPGGPQRLKAFLHC
ncbi:hypothetical protein NLJ89_g8311 [Agrocybe chaxingu]|uniref:Zn(2)-C6 fungal-type domain-containing protein n=1 Tax=Agrocybe chaxingu TaxID=84603 RepID=A0A9W8JXP8_9AGAR|nr:hypothetical protein NLJ89_g8311 [Agrocybe chaxingu]